MDIIQLYTDFSITYQTEGHKHTRHGWVNTECPFCIGTGTHIGLHLGYNIEENFFTCWRCGGHPITQTIAKLLNVRYKEAEEILKNYNYTAKKIEPVKIKMKAFVFPTNTKELQINHKRYLESRNFDPEKIQKEWGILGTGPLSKLDNIDYRFRIIIPFKWGDKIVSFDSRDITGKHVAKYMACPKDRETIPHKDILYCNQKKMGTTAIAVEGPTDVWRFGYNSFATSGIKFTPKQIQVIAKTFKRVPVCFDGGEIQARNQAKILVAELKLRNVDSFLVKIDGDPGTMEQSEADYLIKQLIK